MTLSIVYGSAFLDNRPVGESERIRVYRHRGDAYIGHDTADLAHVCNRDCAETALTNDGFVSVDPSGAVRPDSKREEGSFTVIDTADVYDFDQGDDTYIVCAACGRELLRDDAAHLAMYGVPINRERTDDG